MGLFSIFGGSSSSSVSSTKVDVEVNPEITTVNLVDLGPVQRLVDNLAGVQLATAELQTAGLAFLAAGQKDVALAQREATEVQRVAGQAEGSRARDLMLLLAGGVSLFALSRVRA